MHAPGTVSLALQFLMDEWIMRFNGMATMVPLHRSVSSLSRDFNKPACQRQRSFLEDQAHSIDAIYISLRVCDQVSLFRPCFVN